jgi:mannitol-specific phosphotransferase system IIBC component
MCYLQPAGCGRWLPRLSFRIIVTRYLKGDPGYIPGFSIYGLVNTPSGLILYLCATMILRVITFIIAVGVVYSLLKRYIFSMFSINMTTNEQLKQMQKQLKEMDKKLNKQNSPLRKKRKDGDYIDYEEVS